MALQDEIGAPAAGRVRVVIAAKPQLTEQLVTDQAHRLAAGSRTAVIENFVGAFITSRDFTRAVDFAAAPSAAGWTSQNIITALGQKPMGLSPAEWGSICAVLSDGRATGATAAEFGSVPVWTVGEKKALAEAFEDDQQGISAAEWKAVAAKLSGVNANTASAASFIGLTRWTAAERALAAEAFQADRRGLAKDQWVALCGELKDANGTAANFLVFATMPRLGFGDKRAMAKAFNANRYGMTATEFAAVVDALGALYTADAAKAFVALAGWTAALRRDLAASYAGNQRACSAAEWCAVAAGLGGANATVANAVAFLNAAALTADERAELAAAFQANRRGATVADWIAAALLHGTGAEVANRTARCMAYRAAGWPARTRFSDGAVLRNYRLKGTQAEEYALVYELENGAFCPHITLHGIGGYNGPAVWEGGTAEFQVVMANRADRKYRYRRTVYYPFGGGPAEDPVARVIALDFHGATRNGFRAPV